MKLLINAEQESSLPVKIYKINIIYSSLKNDMVRTS